MRGCVGRAYNGSAIAQSGSRDVTRETASAVVELATATVVVVQLSVEMRRGNCDKLDTYLHEEIYETKILIVYVKKAISGLPARTLYVWA